jgi:DNA-binding transcriptional LysR family regulator
MRINFDFGDLEAFLAVAEYGSYQRAAHELSISQPALTRRIQKLEKHLGVTLFERTTRSLRLTLAAKGFRNRAQAILDDAAETVLALRDESTRTEAARNATVTIAVAPTITQNILPRAIRRFQGSDTKGKAVGGARTRIRVLDHLAANIVDAVAGGDADFGIGIVVAQEPGLSFETLMEESFVLALRCDDPLAAREVLCWAEIDETRFIAPWKGTGNRMLIDDALARQGQSLGWRYEVRHSATVLGLVKAGVGIAALPMSAIPANAGTGDEAVTWRPLVDPEIRRAIVTVRRSAQTLPAAAEAFYRVLSEMYADG